MFLFKSASFMIFGLLLDILTAFMSGTVFYFIWSWLVTPTFEILPLTWTAAVIVVFTTNFLTGATSTIPDTEDFGELLLCIVEAVWTALLINTAYLGIAALLMLILI